MLCDDVDGVYLLIRDNPVAKNMFINSWLSPPPFPSCVIGVVAGSVQKLVETNFSMAHYWKTVKFIFHFK